MRTQIALFLLCTAFWLKPGVLFAEQSESNGGSRSKAKFYYRNSDLVSFANRFEIAKPTVLSGVRVVVCGDTGYFRVRIFELEGGFGAPVLLKDVIEPIVVNKNIKGIQNYDVKFRRQVLITQRQFFVCIDSLSPLIHVMTDTVRRKATCTSKNNGDLNSQIMRNKSGAWYYSRYRFALEPSEDPFESELKKFVYDSTLFDQRPSPVVSDAALGTVSKSVNSIACADINSDGYSDLLCNGHLYLNQSGQKFRDVTTSSGLREVHSVSGFSDVNNDGLLDIISMGLRTGDGGKLCVSTNQGNCLFETKQVRNIELDQPLSYSFGDFNRDGYTDLVVVDSSTQHGKSVVCRLFYNDRHSSYVEATHSLHSTLLNATLRSFVTMVDLDGDTYPEIFLGPSSSGDSLTQCLVVHYHQDSLTVENLQKLSSIVSSANQDNQPIGCAWADFDNDLTVDPVIPRRNGFSSIYRSGLKMSKIESMMPSSDQLPGGTERLQIEYSAGQSGAAAADVNNDGYVDCLLLSDCECRFARLLLQQPRGVFREASVEYGLADLQKTSEGLFFDYNNDGMQDLVLLQDSKIKLFRNERKTGSSYLDVQLTSKTNMVPTNATVLLYTPSRTYSGQVIQGRGLLIQDPTTLHFGLAAQSTVDSVVVKWPGNKHETFTGISPGKTYTLKQGTGYGDNSLGTVQSLSCLPNPFRQTTLLRYFVSTRSKVTIDIRDIDARLVRTLTTDDMQEKGEHSYYWDGNSDQGLRAAPGVYVVRVQLDEQIMTEKVLLVD